MAKILYAVVALLTVLVSPAFAADITAMTSFSPVREFASGEGEGYARSYVDREKADIVRILRDPVFARQEMRVSCETLVQQLMQVHPELPFEGCEGAAAAIERDLAFEVLDCDSAMFTTRNSIAVTNRDGTAFGAWNRACMRGEKVLAYKGKEIISLTCLNPVIPVTPITQVTQESSLAPQVFTWRYARADEKPSIPACPMITDIRIYDSRAAQVSEVRSMLAQVVRDAGRSGVRKKVLLMVMVLSRIEYPESLEQYSILCFNRGMWA